MSFLSKAWKKVKNTVKKVARVVKAIVHRIVKIVDLIASLLGIRPRKHVRLRVQILLDLKKQPVVPVAEVDGWVQQARKTLRDRCNIELHSASHYIPIADVMTVPAPAEAVFPGCSVGAAFGDANDFFEDHCNYPVTSTVRFVADALGFGESLYAFAVQSIGGAGGCSFPVITSYSLVEQGARVTSLVHEMGHLCGLWFPNGGHTDKSANLMNLNRSSGDDGLTRWQISVIRTSRYVTYVPP